MALMELVYDDGGRHLYENLDHRYCMNGSILDCIETAIWKGCQIHD